MRGTAVESIPGGLLDLLLSGSGLGAPTQALGRGRAGEAGELLQPLAGQPVPDAWLYLARHSTLLALPDDGALPYVDAVDARPPWPHQPDELPPDHPDYPVCSVLVQLCAGLRDLRGMLPPLTDPRSSPAGSLRQQGTSVIESARRELVPSWPELDPYLDLLGADLAARAGHDAAAWSLLTAAGNRFTEQGNTRAVAATLLTAGDWHACPLGSPPTWGLTLAGPSSQNSSVSDLLEAAEQSPPTDPARAAAAYDEAESCYARHGDRRGIAHVAWRRAYLRYVTAEPGAAVDPIRAASRALRDAGDEGAALTADAQATLAALAAGELPDVDSVVRPIAAWGADGLGSLSQAIGLGRMFARAGRRWGSTVRRCELALAASSVAEALWSVLGRTVSQSQTRADQADTLRGLGARQAALVTIESALDLATPPTTGEMVMDIRWARPMLLIADLYNLANAAMDVTAMERARRRLDSFADTLRDPANRTTPEQAAIADQFLALATSLDQKVTSLLYQGQEARDGGDQATASRLFTEAEAAAQEAASTAEVTSLLAIVRAFELRMDEAAALFRDWLRERLAHLDALRPQATSTGAAALLLQQERAFRSQAVFFGARTGDTATARQQLEALQQLADPWWSGLGSAWEHHDVEGRLLEAEGQLPAAFQAFSRAIDAVEQVRTELRRDDLRLAFGGDRVVQQVYRNAARVALRQRETLVAADPERKTLAWTAVRTLELGRSRALMDLLAAAHPGSLGPVLDDWRGAQTEVALGRDQLAAALDVDQPDPDLISRRRAALREAERELEDRARQLRTADPRFWQLAGPTAAGSVDPTEVIAGLAEDQAILIFSVDRPDLVSITLTAHGPASSAWSREERRVDAVAQRLLTACGTGSAWTADADQLGAILLEPHADALVAAKRLHVIASGALLGLPFAALRLRGRSLGDWLVVSTLPTLSAYPILAPTSRTGPVLCVGDPQRMSFRPTPESTPVELAPLPGAAVEAAAVATAHQAEPLTGPAATEQAVRDRLPQARIVHLATHGIVDPVSPLASSVLLANGNALTVAELLNLRLDSDVVVLSACQTGTGARIGGDELLGLGRALLAAGARAAVVTLWPVGDVSTAVLMTRFHQAYARGVPAAQALHETQQWIRGLTPAELDNSYDQLCEPASRPATRAASPRNRRRLVSTTPPPARSESPPPSHPAVWAPFVLIGR